jgi:FlaA1/EpsC-like NDP-sugar epimerase
MDKIKKMLDKFRPKITIIIIDLLLIMVSFLTASFIVNGEIMNLIINSSFLFSLTLLIVIKLITYFIFNIHCNVVRYTSIKDVEQLIFVMTLSSVVLFMLSVGSETNNLKLQFTNSLIIIDFFISCFLLFAFRVLVRFFFSLKHNYESEKNTIIIGSSDFAITARRAIEVDTNSNLKVLAYIDEVRSKIGKNIEGIPVYDITKIKFYIKANKISKIIIAKSDYNDSKYNLIDYALRNKIEISKVPEISDWINGRLSVGQIRKIKIEDLLGREPIKINTEIISQEIKQSNILVTGAAGSIGSEIVRQLIKFRAKTIILFDQAETPMFHIEMELSKNNIFPKLEFVIGDIRDKNQILKVFERFSIDYVFHAAAYKHVPLMELNPEEAVKTNVFGTKNIVEVSDKYRVKKFIMISTDKAVKPTNVMGATKRMAEMITQGSNGISSTDFIITRFGNVLGSNGSVIPYFTKQIENGGPITITHSEITRYFMTIPEACQLVLQASVNGNGGEIFVFDMGKPVKIIELAKKMIQLSGLELNKDIKIKFIGLRPGEKLYEELLNNHENTIPTFHPKIKIAKVQDFKYQVLYKSLEYLEKEIYTLDSYQIVGILKKNIPEYISNNSEFEVLDRNIKL